MTPREKFKIIRDIATDGRNADTIRYALANPDTHGVRYLEENFFPFLTGWYGLTDEESDILSKYVRQEYEQLTEEK